MAHIISSKRLLFQKTDYHDEIIDDKKTGRTVHVVADSIIVHASPDPQLVPDWIKEDPLFDISVEDGAIVELVASKPNGKPNTALKGIKVDTKQKEAVILKPGSDTKNPNVTGWSNQV